jgi:protein SCO1/2
MISYGLPVAILLGLASAAQAATVLDQDEALRISQAAIGKRLDNLSFRDTDRGPVRLADFRGKPLIVNLVYTGCTRACPLVVQTLYDAVASAQDTFGDDAFAVVTVGFDPRHDTPKQMRAYARAQGVDLPGWRFLSGDAATIERLAGQIGFVMVPSPQGFDHMAQTTIVDQDGIVYRQVYGAAFDAPALVEPLKDLLFGRRSTWTSLDGLVNRVRLFCTLYDPRTGGYRFDYSVVIGAAIGLVSLSGVLIVLVREWRRSSGSRTHA